MTSNTPSELEVIAFAQKAGIHLTAVGYPSTSQWETALMRNDIQFLFVPYAPFMNDSRVTMLAATSPQRMGRLPNVPTIRESGFDYDGGTDIGLYVPARTPDAVVARIGADAAAVLKMPDIAAKLRQLGFEVSGLLGPGWDKEKETKVRVFTELASQHGVKPQ